jgi:pimeloyl-ACP methyl ester carboxylesterase
MKALYLGPANFTATAGELAVMQESVQAISPRYGEIDVPVIILAGSSDQMVDVEGNVRALGQALTNRKLVLVEDTGHKLHHTHSDVVMDAIDRVMEASAR